MQMQVPMPQWAKRRTTASEAIADRDGETMRSGIVGGGPRGAPTALLWPSLSISSRIASTWFDWFDSSYYLQNG